MTKVPTFDQLMNPLITALRDLGGSGSIDEIYERVIQNLKLPEEVLSVLHDPEASNQTEVYYRLAWARTYLKKYGSLTNSTRGVWALAKPDLTTVDPKSVVKTVRGTTKRTSKPRPPPAPRQPPMRPMPPKKLRLGAPSFTTSSPSSLTPLLSSASFSVYCASQVSFRSRLLGALATAASTARASHAFTAL